MWPYLVEPRSRPSAAARITSTGTTRSAGTALVVAPPGDDQAGTAELAQVVVELAARARAAVSPLPAPAPAAWCGSSSTRWDTRCGWRSCAVSCSARARSPICRRSPAQRAMCHRRARDEHLAGAGQREPPARVERDCGPALVGQDHQPGVIRVRGDPAQEAARRRDARRRRPTGRWCGLLWVVVQAAPAKPDGGTWWLLDQLAQHTGPGFARDDTDLSPGRPSSTSTPRAPMAARTPRRTSTGSGSLSMRSRRRRSSNPTTRPPTRFSAGSGRGASMPGRVRRA